MNDKTIFKLNFAHDESIDFKLEFISLLDNTMAFGIVYD